MAGQTAPYITMIINWTLKMLRMVENTASMTANVLNGDTLDIIFYVVTMLAWMVDIFNLHHWLEVCQANKFPEQTDKSV